MTRTYRHRLTLLLLSATLVAAAGCQDKPTKQPAQPANVAGYVDVTLPDLNVQAQLLPEPTGLQLSDHEPVGRYLLPERIVEINAPNMPQDPNISRFEVEASLEDVMDFYSRRGYKVVRNPKGASVFPRSGDGILQVLRAEGRKLRLVVINSTSGTGHDEALEHPEKLD